MTINFTVFGYDNLHPDAWLPYYDRRIFKRRVGQNGTISVGNHDYYVGYTYAGQAVDVFLDAEPHAFNILHKDRVLILDDVEVG